MQSKSIVWLVRCFTLLFIFSFWACEPSSKKNAGNSYELINEEDVKTLDAEFVKFHNRFHTDSLFQLESIEFPLRKDPHNFRGEVWTRDNWVMHKPFDNSGNMFKRDFEVLNSMYFEEIKDANGFFNMVRRWVKLSDDSFKLIYYHAYNPSEGLSSSNEE